MKENGEREGFYVRNQQDRNYCLKIKIITETIVKKLLIRLVNDIQSGFSDVPHVPSWIVADVPMRLNFGVLLRGKSAPYRKQEARKRSM